MLSTPVEEQAQRKSTLEALQSALTITAAKTPYLENGKIDLREYDRLLERQIEGGVEGVIVGGTTGEGQVRCLYHFHKAHGLMLMMHSPMRPHAFSVFNGVPASSCSLASSQG